MPQSVEIQLICVVTAVACALPGVFLVLRRMALLSDAISHSILFGIVTAYLLTRDLRSPWLMIGATLTGVLTVYLVELLHRTGLVRQDAATGLVFPVLFSVAVILISVYVRNVHLDEDAVLLGAPEYSAIDRFTVGGVDVGPTKLWFMLGVLALNLVFILLFYKELKLATFDAALAATFGFLPGLLHYGLMTLVSLTAVGAFDVVGSVLVVALMIVPPATAYLLTDRLAHMLWISAGIGAASALAGTWLALPLDLSMAGSMVLMTGVCFGAAWMAAPEHGLIAKALRHGRRRWEFAQTMLAIHLMNHEDRPEADRESEVARLHEHLDWRPDFVLRVARLAERGGLVREERGHLALTETGRERARRALVS